MGLLEAPVLWTNGTWERRDYPTVMSGWVVRYRVCNEADEKAEISASRERVCINGVSVATDLQGKLLIDVVNRAWRQYVHLRRTNGRPLLEAEQHAEDPGVLAGL